MDLKLHGEVALVTGATRPAFRNSPKRCAAHSERLLDRQSPLPIVNGLQPAYTSLLSEENSP
jgi:hypothetical protein